MSEAETENQLQCLPRRVRRGRRIEALGVACGAGAPDPGCGDGPEALRRSGIEGVISRRGVPFLWGETLYPFAAGDPSRIVLDANTRVARSVAGIVARGALPVVLGGDHSCAIGTWKGIATALGARGSLGLIWVDAHMDAHTPLTTLSGMLHGMPLACLFGHGAPELVQIASGARLDPRHLSLVGVRSFEAGEAALLDRLGVRVFMMEEVLRRGLRAVMREALAIANDGTAGYGITVDLDALDPRDAPGVGSPVPGGIRRHELLAALPQLRTARLAGIEIVEYNPYRDRTGDTAALVADLLAVLLESRRATRPRRARMTQAGAGHRRTQSPQTGRHNPKNPPVRR